MSPRTSQMAILKMFWRDSSFQPRGLRMILQNHFERTNLVSK
jgi:hypothetical protein